MRNTAPVVVGKKEYKIDKTRDRICNHNHKFAFGHTEYLSLAFYNEEDPEQKQ